MCYKAPQAQIQTLPAVQSEEDKFREQRQQEINRLRGMRGRTATIFSSGMGDTNFGTNIASKVLGSGGMTALGGGPNRSDR